MNYDNLNFAIVEAVTEQSVKVSNAVCNLKRSQQWNLHLSHALPKQRI